jgi:hypothetical protein
VGGARGVFPGPDGLADLDRALAGVPAQLARGFTTICVKPSQFIDDTARMGEFCQVLAGKASALAWPAPRPDQAEQAGQTSREAARGPGRHP